MYVFNSPRLSERREGFDLLKELTKDKSKCFIIHYSCESFITIHGRTPRVTSICIRNLNSSQTTSFSIHLQAQFEGVNFDSLTDVEYDNLELKILNEFSEFVKTHSTFKWIHWNMRDSNYGFAAINHRIRILKGSQFQIADDFKYDFPKIINLIYTSDYEVHRPNGKLLNLAKRNSISPINALTGSEEAESFNKKEYLKLHMSTLKKVDIIHSIIYKVETKNLKVLTTTKQIYGLTIPGVISMIKDTPWLLLITTIIGYLLNILLEPVIQKLFHTGA